MPIALSQLEQITAGVTRPKVTLRDVRNLKVRLPSLAEPDGIRQRIACMDQRLDAENGIVKKLQKTKSGLMENLATGRVRVAPLANAADNNA